VKVTREFRILNIEPCMRLTLAFRATRQRNLTHWVKESHAGLALLVSLAWLSPFALRADTATQQKTANPAKQQSATAAHHQTHKASTTASQHTSARRAAKRHVSSQAAKVAAARRRRAGLRPEPERIQEIQQALVKSGYLSAEPNGRWDDRTREAMRRYQADHGFSVTGLPEAKSLMKLGLGPHPLPPELDSGSGASAGAATDANAPSPPNSPTLPASPDAQKNPPSPATPQP
jgi:hypothetical protein